MIYWFSGTGNSRYVAERIAGLVGEPTQSIDDTKEIEGNEALVGLVFPVYGWMPPAIVRRFAQANAAKLNAAPYSFAVMTCGDDAGKALDVLRATGVKPQSAFTVIMPNTYVSLPGFDIDSDAVRKHKLQNCAGRIDHISAQIAARAKVVDIHEGMLPRTKTYLLGRIISGYLTASRKFRAGDACNSCGTCARACPVGNIPAVKPRPVWGDNCTGCLACYHVCPRHAIAFGSFTGGKGQYTLKRHTNEIPAPQTKHA